MTGRLSVFVVDDSPIVVAGLRSLLRKAAIELTSFDSDVDDDNDANQAETPIDLLIRTALSRRPDVIVMEARLNDKDILYGILRIQTEIPDQAIIVYSDLDPTVHIARAVALGAWNYVGKHESAKRLLRAIQDAAKRVPPPADSKFAQIQQIMNRRTNVDDPGFSFTRREMQVFRLLGLGLSNHEISVALKLSLETIKEHVQNVLRKTNTVDRTQVAGLAVKRQLI